MYSTCVPNLYVKGKVHTYHEISLGKFIANETCMWKRFVRKSPYGGKLWWGETLANLVNDHKFAKFKSSKFYFSNTSRDLEAQLA